jgi:hypothetical protein
LEQGARRDITDRAVSVMLAAGAAGCMLRDVRTGVAPFLFWLLAAGACGPSPRPCPAVPAPAATRAVAPAAAASAPEDVPFEARIQGATLVYVFRASKFTNLAYELDCLAGLTHCSKPAFEPIWRDELGGLDAADEQALKDWHALRYRYGGRIQKRDDDSLADPGLPLPLHGRQFESRVRLATYTAGDIGRFAQNVALFFDPPDVRRAVDILGRFAPRFERHWRKVAPVLERAVHDFPATLRQKKLDQLVDQVARFYGADLPAGSEITFDLVARPVHDSASNAEPIVNHALVEVIPGEAPEDRLDVVLHELFHYFYASAKHADLVALLQRFAGSSDPLAYPAHGVLDESLATALGNGIALRRIDAKRLDKRLARPRGLYADDLIDAVSKKLLEPLGSYLDAGHTLGEPAFFTLYMDAVKRAFPDGMPPRAYLRPWICFYELELDKSYDALDRAVRAGQTVSEGSLSPEARALFAGRKRWTRVLMVRNAELAKLRPWQDLVGPDALAAIEKRAKNGKSFVHAGAQADGVRVFVFVAPDDPAMQELVGRFAKLERMQDGVLAPAT